MCIYYVFTWSFIFFICALQRLNVTKSILFCKYYVYLNWQRFKEKELPGEKKT